MKKIFTLLFAFCIVGSTFGIAITSLTVTGGFPDNSWNNANTGYLMTQIGTTGVYMLEKTLPAGTYDFKVFKTGTWDGPAAGENRQIILTAEKTVKFYAKFNGSQVLFFSDAQEIYVIGAAVGGWDLANAKLMTNNATDATYTADVVGGTYKLIVKDNAGAIIWNDITPSDMTVAANGNHTIKLDFATFAATATANGSTTPTLSTISNSYIFVGQSPESATWYNGSATAQPENFNGKNLGSVTTPIYLGAELTTAPVLEGVVAKMFIQVNDLAVKEVVLPHDTDNGTENSKWKSTSGTNVFTGYSLTKGTTYSLKVWFSATEGTTTLWDSNNMANYVATFTYDLETNEKTIKSEIQIVTENGLKVYFPGNAQIELFNFNGQKIHSEFATGEFSREIGKGAYILKINNEIFKLMIK
jgi:hypothetical protein